jgi:hypothetical protein
VGELFSFVKVTRGLVRFVTGYGDAGHALVTGGVDKVCLLNYVLLRAGIGKLWFS